MEIEAPGSDYGKFVHMKSFINSAREFHATHSEESINLMSRYLGLIASSCELSIFTPGRSEVCAFFSNLWEVMSHPRGPHWPGVAVLARASQEPGARHALTHTYRFMPILTRLLTDSVSMEKRMRLLSLMQDITYGIRISWQESYLTSLLKMLTEWVTTPPADIQSKALGSKALTVLVNVCYGNLPAIYTLMRTVDTRNFIAHLVGMKEGGYGGVQVCRLLLCLQGSRGSRGAAPQAAHVHGYLSCAMHELGQALRDRDPVQLLQTNAFLSDLCADSYLKSHVLTYPNYGNNLGDIVEVSLRLCSMVISPEADEPDNAAECIQNALKFLSALVKLELFTLRPYHPSLVQLCIKASRLVGCLGPALEMFAAVVAQYKDDSTLPVDLVTAIFDGLTGMLVPPALEPTKSALPWVQLLSALCSCQEMQEALLQNVSPDAFEDTLYSLLQHTAQNGAVGSSNAHDAIIYSCSVCLCLAQRSDEWDSALSRLLANHQVSKGMASCLSSSTSGRRHQVLQMIKHPHFPPEKINQIFGNSDLPHTPSDVSVELKASATINGTTSSARDSNSGGEGLGWGAAGSAPLLTPAQEETLDELIGKLCKAFESNQIKDIATSSVMELYGYKMSCLEQRLHSYSVGLQGATEHMSSLQHTIALLQATNSSQQDVLYTIQTQNEKYKDTISSLSGQLGDAEKALKSFRSKLAAERLDKENLIASVRQKHQQEIMQMEGEVKSRDKMINDNEKSIAELKRNIDVLKEKLEQQALKNSELAGVLIKFEERVKHRDKRLEEANVAHTALRKDNEHLNQTVKQLEKTLAERESRLNQVTLQLEEMQRVQEMVAKLMGSAKQRADTTS